MASQTHACGLQGWLLLSNGRYVSTDGALNAWVPFLLIAVVLAWLLGPLLATTVWAGAASTTRVSMIAADAIAQRLSLVGMAMYESCNARLAFNACTHLAARESSVFPAPWVWFLQISVVYMYVCQLPLRSCAVVWSELPLQ